MKAMRRPKAHLEGLFSSPMYRVERMSGIERRRGLLPTMREHVAEKPVRWQDHPVEGQKYLHIDFNGFGFGTSRDASSLLKDILKRVANENHRGNGHGNEHQGAGSRNQKHMPILSPEKIKHIARAKAMAEQVQRIIDQINRSRAIVNLKRNWNPRQEPGFTHVSLASNRHWLSKLVRGRLETFDKVSGPAYQVSMPKVFGRIYGIRGKVGPTIDSSINDLINGLTYFYRRTKMPQKNVILQRHQMDLNELNQALGELNQVSRKISGGDISAFNQELDAFWSRQYAKARAGNHN